MPHEPPMGCGLVAWPTRTLTGNRPGHDLVDGPSGLEGRLVAVVVRLGRHRLVVARGLRLELVRDRAGLGRRGLRGAGPLVGLAAVTEVVLAAEGPLQVDTGLDLVQTDLGQGVG